MPDTLAIARDLRAAGFSQEQAEALAIAIGRTSGIVPDLPTKIDVDALRSDIEKFRISTKAELAGLRVEFKERLAETVEAFELPLRAWLDTKIGRIVPQLTIIAVIIAGLLFIAPRFPAGLLTISGIRNAVQSLIGSL